jgi:amino acid permease
MFRFTQAGIIFVIAGTIIGAGVLVYDVAKSEGFAIIPAADHLAPATNKP